MIEFTIPGEPKAKARPRMSTKTGHTYTPQDTINYENWVKQCFMLSRDKKRLEGQLAAKIYCYFTIPKSASKKKRELMLNGKIRPTKKPDIDNVCKAILDSLNGIAYHDDSQVVECLISKCYSEIPRVDIKLLELEAE
ncbi:MAG TPA: RusA family crossover junction endodeoxyribonuclease [Clostridiaceae bacterium]